MRKDCIDALLQKVNMTNNHKRPKNDHNSTKMDLCGHTSPFSDVLQHIGTCRLTAINCNESVFYDNGVWSLMRPQQNSMDSDIWLSNSGKSDDLEWPSRSFTYCKPFQVEFLAQLFCNWWYFIWHSASHCLCSSWGACLWLSPLLQTGMCWFAVFEQYQKARSQFVQTITELASRPQNIEFLQNAGVMSLLRPLLLDTVPSIQQTAALALGRLANYNDNLAEAVVKGDILPQLVYSLSEQNVRLFVNSS